MSLLFVGSESICMLLCVGQTLNRHLTFQRYPDLHPAEQSKLNQWLLSNEVLLNVSIWDKDLVLNLERFLFGRKQF